MRFSLVLCTVGRTEQFERFVSSLVSQSECSWELIVVDQNPDQRLASIINKFVTSYRIQWIYSEKGLSRARNAGLKCANGDIIAFPDDDCWYETDLLKKIWIWFKEHPKIDGISLTSRDAKGQSSGCHWDRSGGTITRGNIWRRAISCSIFLRCPVIQKVGDFDIRLGVGSGTIWGSGEETDYLLRALEYGFRLEYVPLLTVFHDRPIMEVNASARGYSYGLGFGHVQRKHQYPLGVVLYYWLRSAGGVLFSIAKLRTDQARLHWGNLKGRVIGWLH